MNEVTEVASAPGCRIGTLGDIIITSFTAVPQVAALDLLEKTQDAFVAAKGKVVSLTVISAKRLESPDPAFRERSARLQARFASSVLCSAVVITSSGFAAVIARTFLAGWQLVVRHEKPHQTFRDVASCVAWIQRTAPSTAKLEGAAHAIEKFVAS
jgi:hypothetical protein